MPGKGSKSLDMHWRPHERIEALVGELYPGADVATALNQLMLEIRNGQVEVRTHKQLKRPPPVAGESLDKKTLSIKKPTFNILTGARDNDWGTYSAIYGLGTPRAKSRISPFATLYIENALLSKKEGVDLAKAILDAAQEFYKARGLKFDPATAIKDVHPIVNAALERMDRDG